MAPTTAVKFDTNSDPYVRLEFLKDTTHQFARYKKGDKPELWFIASEAEKLIGAGNARQDATADNWMAAFRKTNPDLVAAAEAPTPDVDRRKQP